MRAKTSLSTAIAAAGLFALASPARADEYIQVNGLPCGTFCRAWMGIKLPAAEKAPADSDSSVQPRAQTESETPPEPRKARKKAHKHRVAKKDARAVDLAHDAASGAPGGADVAGEAEPLRTLNSKQTGAGLMPPTPDTTKAPPGAAVPAPAALASDPTPTAISGADRSKDQGKAVSPPLSPVVVVAPTPPRQEVRPGSAVESKDRPGEMQTAVSPAASPAAEADPEPATPVAKAEPPAPDDVAGQAVAPPPRPTEGAEPRPAPPAAKVPSASQDDVAGQAVGAAPSPTEVAEPQPEAAGTTGEAEKTKQSALPNGIGATADPTAVAAVEAGVQAPAGGQVLIVLVKPEVKGMAELRDKNVIVAGVPSISNEQLKASFAAAGASGAAFKQGDKNDIERLVRGEVSAAVVDVVTPGVAMFMQEIPGFRLLRVDVSPTGKP